MSDAHSPLGQRLNYAQCWEDARLLDAALEPAVGGHLLSIASAGDNALALALAGAEVTAVDLSIPQIACTELKLAGRWLDWDDYRRLLGVDAGGDPRALYAGVRDGLTEPSRGFWDTHPELLEAGLVGAGRFERYLATFRTRILPLVHRRATVLGWFDLRSLEEQRRYYEDRWDTWRWRALFRLFFSRRVMASRGRSPEQFAHVDGPVSEALLGRARRVLTEVSLEDNGYVQWMLAGRFLAVEAEPVYLTEAGHALLPDAARRVHLVTAPLEEHLARVPPGTYDGYNLSDIFEYLSEERSTALLEACARAARPGARLAYWNLFVARERPASLADRLEPLPDLARRLFARDRAFVYGAFRVEEVQ